MEFRKQGIWPFRTKTAMPKNIEEMEKDGWAGYAYLPNLTITDKNHMNPESEGDQYYNFILRGGNKNIIVRSKPKLRTTCSDPVTCVYSKTPSYGNDHWNRIKNFNVGDTVNVVLHRDRFKQYLLEDIAE